MRSAHPLRWAGKSGFATLPRRTCAPCVNMPAKQFSLDNRSYILRAAMKAAGTYKCFFAARVRAAARCSSLNILHGLITAVTNFELSALYPRIPDEAKIADGVERVSPSFVKILNQSLAAESHNLDQLVGIGLRKALEFLIKDYCVYKRPDKAAEIKRDLLRNASVITLLILTFRAALNA